MVVYFEIHVQTDRIYDQTGTGPLKKCLYILVVWPDLTSHYQNMPIKLKPPVDTPGKWVQRREFPGTKSFGFYSCECNKQWMSAHAFKEYRQDCKGL
jgi:hypothetical protein